MKITLILIALCALFMPAIAQESSHEAEKTGPRLHLILHGISAHTEQRANGQRWNERNPGLGIRYEINSTWSIQAGRAKNSLSLPSKYLLVDYTPLQLGPVHAGAFAGRVTGYPQTDYAAGLVARAPIQRASIALRATPKFKSSPSAVALELGLRF